MRSRDEGRLPVDEGFGRPDAGRKTCYLTKPRRGQSNLES